MSAKLFRLLKYYPKNIGLTIPFILGALRQPVGQVLSSAESFEELRALLVALRDNAPDLLKAQILRCPDLDEPIITLFSTEVSDSLRFDSPLNQGRALYVSFYGIFDNDFESLVNSLWERYETILSEGHFSRQRDKTWKPFGQIELTNLKKSCGIE
jgi:hypothetical protein